MAQEVTPLNNPKFCSVIQVDKDISFVLDNRDIDFSLSLPTKEHIEFSRRTYSKRDPISYNSTITLLENEVNGKNNIAAKNKKTPLKNSPKCSLIPQETKEILRKRTLDSDLTITPVPRKIRKGETSSKVSPTRINGRIASTPQKSSQSIIIPSPDPDIEIIQVFERGTSGAFNRNPKNSCNGRERSKERICEIHKKKISKSLPSMLKLCYPSNDDIPITEADIAPVIPSNSFIPDTSICETNHDVIKSPNKWMLSTGVSNVPSLQIVETHGAKESGVKNAHKCNLNGLTAKVSQDKKSSGGRELKNLYANLNEIYWAKEKNFKKMINNSDKRHSERITAKAIGGVGKNLRQLKARSKNKPLYSSKQKRALAKKNSVKLVINRAKYRRLKPPIDKINKKVVSKPFVKPNKKLKVDIKVKNVQPKVSGKQKTDTALKPKYQIISSGKNPKVLSNSQKSKLGNNSRGVEQSLLPSALKKAVKTDNETQVISRNSSDGEEIKRFEYSNEVKILRKSLSNNKVYTSAMKKGSNLRVHVEPLEHTNLWNSKIFETFSKNVLEQSASQMESSESIKAMFEELMESWYNNLPENAKLVKKKKPEEESLRSSVRQSEGAFRYKEIVVKKQENYMQIILIPNTVKQNSLSIEAMKEIKDAFLLAKKDPNCRGVLLNSSGSFFCTGIDLSLLIGSNKKQLAEEMASTIKDLVLTLSTFTKPVVAAVNGAAVGFGVTLLTFCDVVLASDKATFCIPATRLGYLPEGAITLTLPQVVGSTVATELLLYGRRLTADQALRHGLVSEVIWHSNLMNEVVPRVQVIVSQPLQVMETTKTMVRCQLWDRLKAHVEREWRILPSLWLDAQCQNNIRKALQTGWLTE